MVFEINGVDILPYVTKEGYYISASIGDRKCTYDLNGNLLSEDDYLIYAMVGNECRGVGRKIAGRYFVTVYGEDAVPVNFRLKDIRTGTEYEVSESLVFRGDLVGSVKCPFEFNVSPTSISRIFDGSSKSKEVYSIEGLKVKDVITADELGKLPNGIYIIDGQKIVIE